MNMNIYKYIVIAIIVLVAFFYFKNNLKDNTTYDDKVKEIKRSVDSMSIDELWSELTESISKD